MWWPSNAIVKTSLHFYCKFCYINHENRNCNQLPQIFQYVSNELLLFWAMINRMVLYIYLVVVICLSCNYQITDATPIMKKDFCENCGPEDFCFFQVACVPRNIENYNLQETMKLLEGLNNIIRNKDLIWKLTFFPCLFLSSFNTFSW